MALIAPHLNVGGNRGNQARSREINMKERAGNLLQEPLVDQECLKLLGMKDHPLAHKNLGDATRTDVEMAAALYFKAARNAEAIVKRLRTC
jgi:hypothetical protein